MALWLTPEILLGWLDMSPGDDNFVRVFNHEGTDASWIRELHHALALSQPNDYPVIAPQLQAMDVTNVLATARHRGWLHAPQPQPQPQRHSLRAEDIFDGPGNPYDAHFMPPRQPPTERARQPQFGDAPSPQREMPLYYDHHFDLDDEEQRTQAAQALSPPPAPEPQGVEFVYAGVARTYDQRYQDDLERRRAAGLPVRGPRRPFPKDPEKKRREKNFRNREHRWKKDEERDAEAKRKRGG